MNEQRIMVAFDGSRHARHALAEAIQMAKARPVRLRIIYVLEAMPWEFGNDTAPGDLRQAFESLVKNGEDILAAARAQTSAAGIEAEFELVETADQNIAGVILDQARQWPADLIIMGTHGRNALQRMIMGSVADSVTRHAAIPVKMFTEKG